MVLPCSQAKDNKTLRVRRARLPRVQWYTGAQLDFEGRKMCDTCRRMHQNPGFIENQAFLDRMCLNGEDSFDS